MLARILAARAYRADFVERAAQTLRDTGAPIVAFTTTFHQTCACLAIAKRLKELPNPPVVCFGGANCEGEMGLEMIRSFPWIDYVCTREGDIVFPHFVERFLNHGETGELHGFLHRGESSQLTFPDMIEDMDSLPYPDYDDYIAVLKASSLDSKVKREIQIEAARGCWWGAKHHCTFCGLNGDTMRYRSKSPDRVYEELKYLYQRYGYKRIDSVDNILDHRYITSVFPRLVAEGIELEMFYEVKANLKRRQLAEMRRGGITMIQPGIESFSTPVLKLMDKGVTGLQNIQLLKWAEELKILPAWNILAGFPGEDPAVYDWMRGLVPLLTHLEPPSGCSPIRLDRFSPLFSRPNSGLRRIRPTQAYYYVFPLGRRELSRLAYFFDFDYDEPTNPETYTRPLQLEIVRWRNARFENDGTTRPRLDAVIEPGNVVRVIDTRACAVSAEHQFGGLQAEMLLACDTGQLPASLERQFAPVYGAPAVIDAADRLLSARLCVSLDGHILSLPVLRNRAPEPAETERDAYLPITAPPNPKSLLRIL